MCVGKIFFPTRREIFQTLHANCWKEGAHCYINLENVKCERNVFCK